LITDEEIIVATQIIKEVAVRYQSKACRYGKVSQFLYVGNILFMSIIASVMLFGDVMEIPLMVGVLALINALGLMFSMLLLRRMGEKFKAQVASFERFIDKSIAERQW